MAATPPITVADVRSRLVGLDQWLNAAALTGYDDARITSDLPGYVRQWERATVMDLTPRRVVSAAADLALYDLTGVNSVVEDRYPYYRSTSTTQFLNTTLQHKPVQQVDRARMMLGNVPVFSIPTQWIQIDRRSGRFWMVPYSGDVTAIMYSAWAEVRMSLGYQDYVPNALAFDYVSGISAADLASDEWADVRLSVSDWAAYRVLCDIAEMFDAGIISKALGSDGIQQNLQYSRFAARKDELKAHVAQCQQQMVEQETGILLDAV
jgi:hypothetical protein